MKEKPVYWGIIVYLCIIFFPVGIWLFVNRIRNSVNDNLNSRIAVSVFGWMHMAFGVFMLVDAIYSSVGQARVRCGIIAAFAILMATIMLIGSRKTKQTNDDQNPNQTYTNTSFAQSANQSRTATGTRISAYASIDGSKQTVSKAEKPTTKVITCPNCGANNVIIVRQHCECEFCGSPIQ